jgi:aspartate racemase
LSRSSTEIADIHRIYLELAQQGLTAPENLDLLRQIARTLVSRDGVDSIFLAGTDLNLVVEEHATCFRALDCAQAHVDAIVAAMVAGGA